MEMLAVDAWKPEWQRWVSFGVSRAAAMGVDGLHASRPIEFDVRAPRDCEAMFDLLTYEKGASVLRMLEQHIGPDTFREGVRLYLRWHEYENAETTDLWKALGEASRAADPRGHGRLGLPSRLPAGRASGREGARLVPLPAALHLPGRARAGGRRRAAAALAGPGDGAGVGGGQGRWSRRSSWPRPRTTSTLPGAPEWAVVNAGGHGFYRVGYAPALLDRLTGRPRRSWRRSSASTWSPTAFALTQAGASTPRRSST